MKPQRSDFIPTGAIKVVPKEYPSVGIYLYTDKSGRPCATCFSGRRQKPDQKYWYSSLERREQAIRKYLESIQATQTFKSSLKANRTLASNPLKVGDILTGSWGYEQTNPEAYQVREVKGASVKVQKVKLRQVGVNTDMSDYVEPIKDACFGDPTWKRAQTRNNGQSVYLSFEHFSLTLWDGRKMYRSWYA